MGVRVGGGIGDGQNSTARSRNLSWTRTLSLTPGRRAIRSLAGDVSARTSVPAYPHQVILLREGKFSILGLLGFLSASILLFNLTLRLARHQRKIRRHTAPTSWRALRIGLGDLDLSRPRAIRKAHGTSSLSGEYCVVCQPDWTCCRVQFMPHVPDTRMYILRRGEEACACTAITWPRIRARIVGGGGIL